MQGKGMTDMGENILLVAVLLLALYGCTQLIRWLVLRLLTPPARDKGVRILPLDPPQIVEIGAATLPDLSPAARTFLDFLEPHLVEFLSEKS